MMDGIELEVVGEAALLATFPEARRGIKRGMTAAMARCAKGAYKYAYANAPRSPTKTNAVNAERGKASRKRKKVSFWKRFLKAFSGKANRQRFPGGLEKSIEFKSTSDTAEVFVARNSYAADYARYIHDGKGILWHNRGPGTEAKGPQADDKFIERAINDHADQYERVIADEVNRALGF